MLEEFRACRLTWSSSAGQNILRVKGSAVVAALHWDHGFHAAAGELSEVSNVVAVLRPLPVTVQRVDTRSPSAT